MPPDLPDLPVVEVLEEFRARLVATRRGLLVAPPGAGKTTLVPLDLLGDPAVDGVIVLLEPRRLAARAAARRMADLLGERVGDTVGYQTRDERRIGPSTRIQVLTEGVLTRRIARDPELPGIGVIIFDEVHERNLTTDLGLALALEVAETIRPDLMIAAMSATPDTDRLRRVLGDIAPVESAGRTHPVDVVWAPSTPSRRGPRQASTASLDERTTELVVRALGENEGDILVFLPGIGEIRRTQRRLEGVLGSGIDVHALAGSIGLEEQDAALRPSPTGRRRVVLATDIAETSLTVDGVRVVVDSGLTKVPRHDAASGMSRLVTIAHSRSAAEQRAGRAGRQAPGVCYRMWSAIEHATRSAHPSPEITEADLAGFRLEVAAWGTPVAEMRLLTHPPASSMRAAEDLLVMLGALDRDGAITDIGRAMLELPLHPRLARMLVDHPDGTSCAVAAVLDDRDIVRGRSDSLPTDLALRVAAVNGDRVPGDLERLIDRGALERVRARARDLADRAGITMEAGVSHPDSVGQRLLAGFPDRVAVQRRPGQFQLQSGTGAFLDPDDSLATADHIVAVELDGRRDRARVRLAAAVSSDDVVRRFADIPGAFVRRQRLVWDTQRDDLVAIVERRLGAIRLGERTERPEPGPETIDALLDRVRATRLAVLGWSERAVDVRQRIAFLHSTIGDPWPDTSPEALIADLETWLAPYLGAATSRADLEGVDPATLLRAMLPWPEGADLDRLAPTGFTLPRARDVPIRYEDANGQPVPTAHVRVQSLFGVDEQPTVAGIPIVLHLLSPAGRPIQITSDLPGFWRGSWADVRKEMAGRYPKHPWPADPIGGTA
jgi:ATP-dependent helicase HrpB